MIRQSWFDFGGKTMLKHLNLDRTVSDQAVRPGRMALWGWEIRAIARISAFRLES